MKTRSFPLGGGGGRPSPVRFHFFFFFFRLCCRIDRGRYLVQETRRTRARAPRERIVRSHTPTAAAADDRPGHSCGSPTVVSL